MILLLSLWASLFFGFITICLTGFSNTLMLLKGKGDGAGMRNVWFAWAPYLLPSVSLATSRFSNTSIPFPRQVCVSVFIFSFKPTPLWGQAWVRLLVEMPASKCNWLKTQFYPCCWALCQSPAPGWISGHCSVAYWPPNYSLPIFASSYTYLPWRPFYALSLTSARALPSPV